MGFIGKLLGFATGGSPYLLLLVAIGSSLMAGTLAWNIRGWKADSDIAVVEKTLADFRLQVAVDANEVSSRTLDTVQKSLSQISTLQGQVLQKQQVQSATSKTLLERLDANANASETVCPATVDYLDELRQLQRDRTNPVH